MIEVYTDAASQGSPGLSGAGVVLIANGQRREFVHKLGIVTNHEAEFQAVLEALKICQRMHPNAILSFHSDSQLVVDAIEKKYVKNKLYRPMLDDILNIANTFPYFFIKWIPGNKNPADSLAKCAIQAQLSEGRTSSC